MELAHIERWCGTPESETLKRRIGGLRTASIANIGELRRAVKRRLIDRIEYSEWLRIGLFLYWGPNSGLLRPPELPIGIVRRRRQLGSRLGLSLERNAEILGKK